MPTPKLPQTPVKADERIKIQILISPDADARLKVAAAVRRMPPGEIVSEALIGLLPPAPEESLYTR